MAAAATQEQTGAGVHLVLYDGECGLCSRVVQFVLRRDVEARFRFARLQGPIGRAIVARYGGDPRELSTLYVVPGYDAGHPTVLTKSDAALFIAATLGGSLAMLRVGRLVPRALRDAAYDVVARHRHRADGVRCFVPSADARHRFLD